jgi:Cdc6-like AAA superfamily ATPase
VLGLKPLALAQSRFVRNTSTSLPLTIAITGPWGTGKSSLMNLVAEDLRQRGASPVWFNAWHHQKEENILAALFENIRAQASPSAWRLSGLWFRLRLLKDESDCPVPDVDVRNSVRLSSGDGQPVDRTSPWPKRIRVALGYVPDVSIPAMTVVLVIWCWPRGPTICRLRSQRWRHRRNRPRQGSIPARRRIPPTPRLLRRRIPRH